MEPYLALGQFPRVGLSYYESHTTEATNNQLATGYYVRQSDVLPINQSFVACYTTTPYEVGQTGRS